MQPAFIRQRIPVAEEITHFGWNSIQRLRDREQTESSSITCLDFLLLSYIYSSILGFNNELTKDHKELEFDHFDAEGTRGRSHPKNSRL